LRKKHRNPALRSESSLTLISFELATALLRAFKEFDIAHQIVGSLASSFHGVPRSSLDIDLLTSGSINNE
jgi:hypothetical protein